MYRWIHIAFAVAVSVIAAVTLCVFGCADGCAIAVSLAVAAVVPWLAARRLSWWSAGCTAVYEAITVVMVSSAVYYVWYHTLGSGATLEMPCLLSDDGIYYQWALHHYDGRCEEPLITFFGFPMAMVALWRLLGVSIVWPVAMNVSLTLGAIVMSGSLAVMLTRRTSMRASTSAILVMLLLGLHGHFLSQGFAVQKEALVYVAMTLAGITLLRLSDDERPRPAWFYVVLYGVAVAILALVRAKYINFVAFGVVLLALSRWRTGWRSILSLACISVVAWLMGMYCSTTYSVAQQIINVTGGGGIPESLGADEGIQGAYFEYLGGYFGLPVWKKVLLLPFTCGTQFIVPLPWKDGWDNWLMIMPRLRLVWYLIGGLWLCYLAVLSWRRGVRLPLVTLWPTLSYIAIAYICAGTISRYILPFQPMFASIAVYVLAVLQQSVHRRSILTAAAVYLVLLVAALIAAALITA